MLDGLYSNADLQISAPIDPPAPVTHIFLFSILSLSNFLFGTTGFLPNKSVMFNGLSKSIFDLPLVMSSREGTICNFIP